jgi:oligopeptide transport system ATP-binding protein
MACVTRLIQELTTNPPRETAGAARGLPVLDVRHLKVGFRREGSLVNVVRDVSFTVAAGETLAFVGESGSGKSVTSLAIMQLTPPAPRTVIEGSVRLSLKNGSQVDLVSQPRDQMRAFRGNEIAMIFQEPMTSLNPVYTIGDQIAEAIRFHRDVSKREALGEALRLLELVGIPDARKRLNSYPHQLSGGMRQRVMIAIAISCEPRVLIADEPTTALDVTVQAQILELLKKLQDDTGMAMIFITHNLGVVAEVADRVMVLYSGALVEEARAANLFERPLMPYTRGLLRSVPRMEHAGRRDIVLQPIPGSAPDPARPLPGCAFHPRCEHRDPQRCDHILPELETVNDRQVRCLRWRELELANV